jgi:cytochrome c oxidase subunit 2
VHAAGARRHIVGERRRRIACIVAAIVSTLQLAGCGGVQSTLMPFGMEASATRRITLLLAIAAAVVTVAVLALAAHAFRAPAGRLDHKGGMRLIFWLGAVFPTLFLATTLVTSLPKMQRPGVAREDLKIAVDGEQFWWRVRYQPAGRAPVETANEIRLPVGRSVEFVLSTSEVIHSFWVPGLAGKVDMIPGRTNTLVVRATQPGVYRGVCAEFCGLSHAHMAFDVVAMAPEDFDRWLEELARPAPDTRAVGRELFGAQGCDGCHSVQGHFAGSAIGPDLTHVASRRTVGAGVARMSAESLAAFVRDPSASKAGALMPSFRDMPDDHLEAVTAYLLELR